MCPILTADGTMYYLGSCNTAEPDGTRHLKCIAKSKQRGLEKGEKICRIWPASVVLLSCKTIRCWNIKKNKKRQLSLHCRKNSGSPQLCRCIKIIQDSEYSFLSPVAHVWRDYTTRSSSLIIINNLLLMHEKRKHFAHAPILFTPRPHCAECTAALIQHWQTYKGSNLSEILGETKHIAWCSSFCFLVTNGLFHSLFFRSSCWPRLLPCLHRAVTLSCPYPLTLFMNNKQNFATLIQTVIGTILVVTQDFRELSASDPIFIGEGGRIFNYLPWIIQCFYSIFSELPFCV